MNRKIRWNIPKDMQIIDGSVLKIVAVITMLIDHAAAGIFLPMMNFGHIPFGYTYESALAIYSTMRAIGRTAFPIYCFLLVEGLFFTRSKKKYAIRMFLFALISEIPFDFALIVKSFEANTFSFVEIWDADKERILHDQNVFWTLLIGLLVIWAVDTIMKKTSRKPSTDAGRAVFMAGGYIISFAIILAGCYAANLLETDYSHKGVMLIVILYLLRTFRPAALAVAYGYIAYVGYSEEWSFPGFILALLYNGRRGFITGNAKYFFYAFYPLHLIIIYIIRAIIL